MGGGFGGFYRGNVWGGFVSLACVRIILYHQRRILQMVTFGLCQFEWIHQVFAFKNGLISFQIKFNKKDMCQKCNFPRHLKKKVAIFFLFFFENAKMFQ